MTRRPILLTLAAAALLANPVVAQTAPTAASNELPDPANLTGEQVFPQSPADTLEINHGAPALAQLLLKLRTRASIMFIVAHPDDEDGGFLAYESRGAGARVAMLTLTRGEGGQNLMSADFNDALGLIRTQELLAEDSYTGVDQFFGTEVDFGFSKTREEALKQWTHDRVLYDAVRSVRLYRPLVLASVFLGAPTDGHGHHQVSGQICQEVFKAAADPAVFPEMNLPPWAPLKVYARVPFSRVTADGMFDYATGKTIPTRFENYVTGQISTQVPQATVLIHEGDPATLSFQPGTPTPGMEGLSYVQFARKGLGLQKTQIGANVRMPPAGRSDTGYTLMASRIGCAAGSGCPILSGSIGKGGVSGESPTALPAQEQTIFDGIDTSLAGLTADPALHQPLVEIDQKLAQAQAAFTPANTELTAPPLRDALRILDKLLITVEATKLPADEKFNLLHELHIKRVQLNDAIVLAHQLTLQAELPVPRPHLLSTDHSLSAKLSLQSKSANSLRIASLRLIVNTAGQGIGSTPNVTLQPATVRDFKLTLPHLNGLFPTRPYFSRPGLEQPFYNVSLATLRNAPGTPSPIVAHATLDDQGILLELAAIVPASGTSMPVQPLVVVQPVSVGVSPAVAILRPGDTSLSLTVALTGDTLASKDCLSAGGTPPDGKFGLVVPDTWTYTPETPPYDPTCPNTHQDFTLKPAATAAAQPAATLNVQAVARADNHNYTESFRPAGYPGLTYTNLYTPATYKATAVDVVTAPGLRIAYLPGTGDSVADLLPNLGVTATILSVADLTPARLAQFDTVVLGVRAYAAHPELAAVGSQPLLDFARQGGVVVNQYNTARLGDAEAPYPIQVPGDSAHNVVEEAQPVTILVPTAPLLTWPNKITEADFSDWVEERGHGFAASWSPKYEVLLETHDSGQEPQRGGLLVAPVGKGAYVYLSLALYRQLPEGIPGAYRLLANLLSYAKNPQR